MPHEWDVTDDEIDSWSEEWEAVDRAAAEYLAERVPGVRDVLTDDDVRWVDALAGTISPSEEPTEHEIESMPAVMALQHADWLGLALGVVRRGPGHALDPELVQADIERLEDVEGEMEDPEGHLTVLDMALLHLTPRWQDLGVLDEISDSQNAARGVCHEPCTGRGTTKLSRPAAEPPEVRHIAASGATPSEGSGAFPTSAHCTERPFKPTS